MHQQRINDNFYSWEVDKDAAYVLIYLILFFTNKVYVSTDIGECLNKNTK